ncbi:hypothetical protein F7725_025135 [Dissostichus mawsoni]|uniref:Uncharacterized protein n=1 Tax=Dissostichus mawsoni TaxID=36200 RepID=A0A7J5XAH9_DISMA|nr:hypothetical protein F7725_025135 [Dissostichus mawsoni]
MVPFAHVADGAEQKAGCPRSQRQSFPVLQVLLTTVDGLKSPLPPQLHQFICYPWCVCRAVHQALPQQTCHLLQLQLGLPDVGVQLEDFLQITAGRQVILHRGMRREPKMPLTLVLRCSGGSGLSYFSADWFVSVFQLHGQRDGVPKLSIFEEVVPCVLEPGQGCAAAVVHQQGCFPSVSRSPPPSPELDGAFLRRLRPGFASRSPLRPGPIYRPLLRCLGVCPVRSPWLYSLRSVLNSSSLPVVAYLSLAELQLHLSLPGWGFLMDTPPG